MKPVKFWLPYIIIVAFIIGGFIYTTHLAEVYSAPSKSFFIHSQPKLVQHPNPSFSPLPAHTPKPHHTVTAPSPLSSEDDSPQEADAQLPDPESESVFVTRVIDGDTIEVLIQGTKETVRLIGIDAPESVSTKTGPQCYGKQSSQAVNQLLLGKQVTLAADPTQDDRDYYHRLLRYVYFDGTLVNKYLIAQGLAKEYTFKKPYRFQADFRAAQATAQSTHAGLWNPETCPLSS